MVDRKPTYKNRVLITKESDGSQEYITWEHADEPITEGTPLNRQTLLSDDTATELGLSSEDEQTPNGAFAKLNSDLAAEKESVSSVTRRVAHVEDDIEALAGVTVTLSASGWSSSVPYTQSVTVTPMTANWKPGIPSIPKSGTVNVTTSLAELEALRCINAISSGTNTLTFMCFEDKPATSITVDVPGQLIVG